MEDRFEIFVKEILRHEGGYVNDPDDWGGETKFGISKRRYPDLDIKNLTMDKAIQIYYLDFYVSMHLDKFIESDLLALHVFDMGVNSGRGVAVRLLQELLNNIKVDGILGPVTNQALGYSMVTTNMVQAYIAKRIERYYKVSLLRNNNKFLKGWINRVYNTRLP